MQEATVRACLTVKIELGLEKQKSSFLNTIHFLHPQSQHKYSLTLSCLQYCLLSFFHQRVVSRTAVKSTQLGLCFQPSWNGAQLLEQQMSPYPLRRQSHCFCCSRIASPPPQSWQLELYSGTYLVLGWSTSCGWHRGCLSGFSWIILNISFIISQLTFKKLFNFILCVLL